MERTKKVILIMLKTMGVQAVLSFVIAIIWLFIQIGNKTQMIGVKPLGIAFCNAFFVLGLACATVGLGKIWWDFSFLKRDLGKDVTAKIAIEGTEDHLEKHQEAEATGTKVITTKEKTWEIAFILLGIIDFAISFAISMALISF